MLTGEQKKPNYNMLSFFNFFKGGFYSTMYYQDQFTSHFFNFKTGKFAKKKKSIFITLKGNQTIN